MWWGSWGRYLSSSVPGENFNAYILGCLGGSWSHYVNVMDTQVPGQEHFITDIIPVQYMKAIHKGHVDLNF